jgi:hypothetical protein
MHSTVATVLIMPACLEPPRLSMMIKPGDHLNPIDSMNAVLIESNLHAKPVFSERYRDFEV